MFLIKIIILIIILDIKFIIILIRVVWLVICVLINVAFITLLERKILGLRQIRLGPNKVSFLGMLQPFSDAIKLLAKQPVFPFKANIFIYIVTPVVSLFIILTLWVVMRVLINILRFKYRVILVLVIIRIGVYPLILIGWRSNRKYRIIGALRGVAQTISYEIRIALLLMGYISYRIRTGINEFSEIIESIFPIILFPFLLLLLFVSLIAETNRTPFDFSEGESELVSGFNIEYGGGLFAIIFLSEYGIIFFFRQFLAIIIVSYNSSVILREVCALFIVFIWVLIRATYPRYRYDKLINLAWKSILPIRLFILLLRIWQGI